jgi:hypothetical protein
MMRKAYLNDKDRQLRERLMHRGGSGYPHASSSAVNGTGRVRKLL